ncbi:MAG: hypothetical protein IT378_24670, partial [Sandaracinaceae bacterium]|nr:hypothetical protein [Sandaracinaceae bacterium]
QAAENAEARSQSQERQQGRPLSADELEAQLRQALENLDRLQMQLGAGGSGLAIPMQGSGNGSGNGNGNGTGSGSGSGSGNGNGNGNGNGSGSGSGSGNGSGNGSGSGGVGQGGGPGPRGGHTDPTGAQDGPLARVRPPLGAGAPSATTFEWVDPEGAPLPAGTPDPSGTATAAEGEAGAIERAPIPEDYHEHVRTYFGGERAR